MRRRLVRLAAVAVALPAAAWIAEGAARRLEASRGPSVASRSLRQVARVADQRAGRLGRVSPLSRSARAGRRRR